MNIRDRRSIHHAAGRSLANAKGDPQKLLLIYLGIITALTLASAAVSVLLSDRIADTGGLRNMGLRSVLSTGQSVLSLVQSVVMVALEIGYCTVALRICRGEEVSTGTLFGGFRRFLPLMGASLIQGALYLGAAMLCLYPSAFLFMLLPVSERFYALFDPLMEAATAAGAASTTDLMAAAMEDEALILALSEALDPMVWIFAVLFLLLFIPMHYKFRMVIYRLIDQPRPRGMLAIRESRFLMRRNRFALFRLDLNFWWFHLLQVLILALCYGDMLLPLFGITLPWSGTVSYFVFLVLSLALQFAVYYFAMGRIAVTYATAYDALLPKEQPEENNAEATEEKPVEKPPVHNNPWKDQY